MPKVPSADNFTPTLSIVYRNYQVFKDLFKITQVVAVMQSSYQNIILFDCNIFLYSRTNTSKDVQIEISIVSVAGQILNVCRGNVESKLGKSGKM